MAYVKAVHAPAAAHFKDKSETIHRYGEGSLLLFGVTKYELIFHINSFHITFTFDKQPDPLSYGRHFYLLYSSCYYKVILHLLDRRKIKEMPKDKITALNISKQQVKKSSIFINVLLLQTFRLFGVLLKLITFVAIINN